MVRAVEKSERGEDSPSLRSAEPVKSKRIVTYVDTSQQAYGAAVYIRSKYHNDAVTNRLIAAKSKVAPLTPMTVPRLELMGAILGLRLTQSLLTVLEESMESVTFYSNSTDVLWWIRGRRKDFRPFVANRIGEIKMFSRFLHKRCNPFRFSRVFFVVDWPRLVNKGFQ